MKYRSLLVAIAVLLFSQFYTENLHAQLVNVGDGSYTLTFPGTDEAGRNGYPAGSPQITGIAVGKPVPTNDWWSTLIQQDHASNLFNYPLAMKTKNSGLVMTYIPRGVIDDQEPIIVGTTGLNASKATVSDYSDWTVSIDWNSKFQATAGIGMPFVYFEKGDTETAQIQVNLGNVTISNEMILVTDARNGADFAIYAPTGSSWTQNGSTYTSTLNGKNYWSAAMLPQDAANPASIAEDYKKYAYVFPINTSVSWDYDETSSVLRTGFIVDTETKEGSETSPLIGLLPHQWANLASDSPIPEGHSYNSIRGELKTLAGNTFFVENSFYGILPTLPYLSNYSEGFNPALLNQKIKTLENEGLATWTDSYNDGQAMNRLIQTARIANKTGNIEARDKIIATVKERLEDWLSAESNEIAFIFYYNQDWSTMLGYPAGHGQDNNINDHHFHWGYFIHAAAFVEQFEPGWAEQWGDMVNLLVRDAASPKKDDSLFPFLRNFSPYAGHCWANGFATFPQGNDQESTPESMQFNSSLIHWGSITGNDSIRDLGIYLYTTEQSATEEYWFDMHERNFEASHPYSHVSRVWGNTYDNGTFWTADIEASYGIELYPIHGGSMYLGHNQSYAQSLWTEIENNTGVLSQDDNVNLWHDVMWKYLAFTDPQKAIDLYNAYLDRGIKFGVSDAQTYFWLHSMNALGQVDTTITSNHPLAVAFSKDGEKNYVAHNYSGTEITVNFSDGYNLTVPAYSMTSNRDAAISGTISSSFPSTYPGQSVMLNVDDINGTPDKIEFYKDGILLGEDLTAPYEYKAEDLSAGVYNFYAKIYEGESFNVTNIIEVVSGSQEAYQGVISTIPGTIEAGHYDQFPGGTGQGIAYLDFSPGNNGDFRTEEDVDAGTITGEGTTIGWISAGEWVEYSISVANSGLYDMSFRFASGNSNGGGPFHLELNDKPVSEDIYLNYTDDWDDWESKTVTNLEIPEGEHILKIAFDHGEFNLGKMTFTRTGDLSYGHPLANAGDNISVQLPASTAQLDGSSSSDPDNDPLTFQWSQVNGPSLIIFSNSEATSPTVSNLVEGIYTCKLEVSDGTHSSTDELYIIVSETGNSKPDVSITSPTTNSTFEEGTPITIQVNATDLEGEITKVEFLDGQEKMGEDNSEPFSYQLDNPAVGTHNLTAVAWDEGGLSDTSEVIIINIAEVKECVQYSNEAIQGSFSIGYKTTYRTVGTNVTVSFELLDKDKSGVVAFLWQENPFQEFEMDHQSGNIFSATLRNVEPGTNLSYACKFAYAGGLSATKYMQYEAGTECEDLNTDLEPPSNFSASIASVSDSTVELNMRAYDNSGSVIFDVKNGSETTNFAANSGEQQSLIIEDLTPGTSYTFTVTAKDSAGNSAANSPITLAVTTTGFSSEETELLKVYPNPATTYITISSSKPMDAESLSILDITGKTQQLKISNHERSANIDMSALPSGVYFLMYVNGKTSEYKKIIKQ